MWSQIRIDYGTKIYTVFGPIIPQKLCETSLIGQKTNAPKRGRILYIIRPVNVERCISCFSCVFACSRRTGHVDLGHAALRIKSTPPPTAGGSGGNFVVVMCRACTEPVCLEACKYDAIKQKQGGGITINQTKCIGCGDCTEACPLSAIFVDPRRNKAVVCIHCGECVEWCPHNILIKEEVEE